MKSPTLAAIVALLDTLTAALPEIRERCADTTFQKLTATATDVRTALDDDTVTDPATVPGGLTDAQFADLRDALALELRAALDEANAPAA